jgi:ribosomal protein S18 acetylase RimI-like enzyme
MHIREFTIEDLEAVVALSLRAWGPVFPSITEAYTPEIDAVLTTPDWPTEQARAVEAVCRDEDVRVWVATIDDALAGFTALKVPDDKVLGEIYMLAVDPGFQGHGVGRALTQFALEEMKRRGVQVAMVETGGDPGHAPARKTYAGAGMHHVEVARYFKRL